MKTDNLKEAAIWFETLRASSPKYAKDCSYYLAYIRYTQKRYDEALKDFLPLQDDPKYKELVPYYIAEIYAIKKNYDKAQIVAQNYLSAYPNNEHAAEMYRILGDAYYHFGQYHQAVEAFTGYLDRDHSAPRRDALYMLGLSYYQTKVYSKAAEMLGQVTTANDALTRMLTCTWDSLTCNWQKRTRHVWLSNRQPPPTPTCRLRNRPLTTTHFACTKRPTPLSVNRLLLLKNSSMNSRLLRMPRK